MGNVLAVSMTKQDMDSRLFMLQKQSVELGAVVGLEMDIFEAPPLSFTMAVFSIVIH